MGNFRKKSITCRDHVGWYNIGQYLRFNKDTSTQSTMNGLRPPSEDNNPCLMIDIGLFFSTGWKPSHHFSYTVPWNFYFEKNGTDILKRVSKEGLMTS